ncbi:MAG: DNA lyase [Nanoarchaeota archaeon]|nr:DNA lyase [Nanoarchaeota archaeon]
MDEIKKIYAEKKSDIKSRLEDFKNLSEEQVFREFQFCLLTPQSNAQRCWSAVLELSKLKNPKLSEITEILSKRTRFHNTKAKRILNSRETFSRIMPFLSLPAKEARDELAKEVNGYGLKEAAHFLRNIGLSNNEVAILDRHILRHLNEEKIKSQKHYLEIEKKFIEYAKSLGIPLDELDLLWWSQENGEIFK